MTGPPLADTAWPPSVTVGLGVARDVGTNVGAAELVLEAAALAGLPVWETALPTCQIITITTAAAINCFQPIFRRFLSGEPPAGLLSSVRLSIILPFPLISELHKSRGSP